MKKSGEKDHESMYIVTSNYLKLASEKDSILSEIYMIDLPYQGTASYLKGKIDRTFEDLTNIYVGFAAQNYEFLDEMTHKLQLQSQAVSRQVEQICKGVNQSDFDQIIDQREKLSVLLEQEKSKQEKQQTNATMTFDEHIQAQSAYKIEELQLKLKSIQESLKETENAGLVRKRLNDIISRMGYIENIKSKAQEICDEKQ